MNTFCRLSRSLDSDSAASSSPSVRPCAQLPATGCHHGQAGSRGRGGQRERQKDANHGDNRSLPGTGTWTRVRLCRPSSSSRAARKWGHGKKSDLPIFIVSFSSTRILRSIASLAAPGRAGGVGQQDADADALICSTPLSGKHAHTQIHE